MTTLQTAKRQLSDLGITLSKRDDEYRVNLRGGSEATAYYTNDIDDAIATGKTMSDARTVPVAALAPVGGKMVATRNALFDTLLDAIAAAPEAERSALATALENFAEARGDGQYRRICERSPIIAELFAIIEEASDARLFARE